MNPKSHTKDVLFVLKQLLERGFFVHLMKCLWGVFEIEFLGFVLTTKDMDMKPIFIETIKDWPEPVSVRDIQVFLGLANFG